MASTQPSSAARRAQIRPRGPLENRRLLNGTKAGVATPFVTRRHTTRVPRRHGPNRSDGDRLPRHGGNRHEESAGTGQKIDFASSPCSVTSTRSRAREPGTVGRPLRSRPDPFRQVHRRQGPVHPPGAPRSRRRINFCIVESAIGVVTGDVGAGKTVSVRAAVSSLDPTRHQVIYIANPAFGTRGLYVTIVRSLGAEPRYLKAELMVQAADLLAAERPSGTAGSCSSSTRPISWSLPSSKSSDCSRTPRWTRLRLRRHPGRPADAQPSAAHGDLRRLGPEDRDALFHKGDGPR